MVALIALHNWQKQDKAKIQSQLLDDVLRASQYYSRQIGSCILYAENALLTTRCMQTGKNPSTKFPITKQMFIAYITKYGAVEGKRMME